MSTYLTSNALTNEFLRSFWGDYEPVIKDEIIETTDGYKISLELPGVKREAINIEFEKDSLVLTIEKKRPEKTKTISSKIQYGKFTKSYYVDSLIDRDSIKAELSDGVLVLSLKKTEAAKSKKITIN